MKRTKLSNPNVTVSFTVEHYHAGLLSAVHNLLACDEGHAGMAGSSLDGLTVLLEEVADNATFLVNEMTDHRAGNVKCLRAAAMKIVAAADAFLLQGEGGDDAGTV